MFQWLIIARLCVSVGCRELANKPSYLSIVESGVG